MLNMKEVGTGWFIFIACALLVALLLEMGAFRRWGRKVVPLLLVLACGFGVFSLLFTDLGATYPLRTVFLREVYMTPQVKEGMEIYFKYGCPNCHQLRGWGTPAGPDLAGIVKRRGEAWVKEYLVNPRFRRTGSTMLHYSFLTEDQLNKLLTFLSAVSTTDDKVNAEEAE